MTHSPSTLKKNRDFDAQMSSVERDLCGRPATVVYAPWSKAYMEPRLKAVDRDLKVGIVTYVKGWTFQTINTRASC